MTPLYGILVCRAGGGAADVAEGRPRAGAAAARIPSVQGTARRAGCCATAAVRVPAAARRRGALPRYTIVFSFRSKHNPALHAGPCAGAVALEVAFLAIDCATGMKPLTDCGATAVLLILLPGGRPAGGGIPGTPSGQPSRESCGHSNRTILSYADSNTQEILRLLPCRRAIRWRRRSWRTWWRTVPRAPPATWSSCATCTAASRTRAAGTERRAVGRTEKRCGCRQLREAHVQWAPNALGLPVCSWREAVWSKPSSVICSCQRAATSGL